MKRTLTVFCLPYAGGNKYSYREFKSKAPSFLDFVTLEYPGRGARMGEPLVKEISVIVDGLFEQIKDKLSNGEYAFYGHSMGGLVTYLLTQKIIENNLKLPLHLFITGTSGPGAVTRGEKKRHLMGQKEFLDEIKEFGGMPDEVLENEELLHYFEPILRSDFEASENYVHVSKHVMDIPITVITGSEEDFEHEDIQAWQNESLQVIDFRRLPGKHFFIFNYVQEIIQIIAKKLTSLTKVHHYE